MISIPSKQRILIIEDDQAIREGLRLLLEEEGYLVNEAANGLEALTSIECHRAPDLILLDVMMPVMGGREFLNRVQGRPELAKTKIVILSALAICQLDFPGYQILKKPLDVDEFLGQIKEMLSLKISFHQVDLDWGNTQFNSEFFRLDINRASC